MSLRLLLVLIAENATYAKQNAYWKQIDDATDVSCLMLAILSDALKKHMSRWMVVK